MNTPARQLIKDTAALKQKKFRDETGLILVEGRHPIEEAVKAGLTLRHWFAVADRLEGQPAVSMPQEPWHLDEAAMARLSTTSSPPPCVAVFERPAGAENLRGDRVLVLDGIQDPGNVGTLMRSALAFGVGCVILTGEHVEPYSPKVIRASAGLVFALAVLEKSCAEVTRLLADPEWTVYATTGDPAARSYRDVGYAGRCAIVLGNEGRGISPGLFAERPVEAVTIPMSPAVESLNVAVSGSILLAEAAAQRNGRVPV